MPIRKDFISYTSPVSAALPLDLLCRITGQNFILPFYHIVSDEPCPHIQHLYSFKNVAAFERDMDYLASHYQPIAATDLEDVLHGKYRGKKIMLLTFDDGMRQMAEIVAPILIRKGIPATFFINTDFIDNKALMFRYKASLALDKDYDKYYNAYDARSEKELREITGSGLDYTFDAFLKDYRPYMTSDHIVGLIDQGFVIGSHSMSHPYYEDLTFDQQLSETFGSIDVLMRDFGIQQRLFAFPFTDHGVSKAFFDRIFQDGKIDFSFGGAGIKNDIHPRQFQRIPMEGWDATAEQILKSEYLYYMLRAPLFKNKIVRS